jgi:hypothetical protein
LVAVTNRGHALEYALAELKADKEVMFSCFLKN